MALTADQITAKNFKMFYDEIRPYLNGQVPTFANTFSRSDLYSTDEKIVGCWIDGKPIYQKAFTFTTPSTTQGNVCDLSANADIKALISYGGCIDYGASGEMLPFPCYLDGSYNTSLKLTGNRYIVCSQHGYPSKSAFAWVQYIKTNDASISVGTGTEYSLDEQVVGKWIDGRLIYQRTFDFGSRKEIPSTTWYDTGFAFGDADIVLAAWGVSGGGSLSTANACCPLLAYAERDNSNFKIMMARDNSSLNIQYFTIQYTKKTT